MTTEQRLIQLEILAKYPQAYSALQGVNIGDVLITHPRVPCIIATEKIIADFDFHEHYFVIANVGDCYESKSIMEE